MEKTRDWSPSCAAASAAAADELQLRNGDRLTGDVIALQGGALAFKTAFGDLTIPWTEVSTLRLDQPMARHGTRRRGAIDDARRDCRRRCHRADGAAAGNRGRRRRERRLAGHDGYFGLSGEDNLFFRMQNGLRFALVMGLVSTIQLDLDYDRSPAPGRRKTDRSTSLTFGYRF